MPIVEVGQRIRREIIAGTYAAGSLLSLSGLAADLCLPVGSVEPALSDLARTGVVTREPTGRFRVPGPEYDRSGQLVFWIKELVAAGVYPVGTALPSRRDLARQLVTSQERLAEALRHATWI
ncbi:GntR family transcriptional regulator [Streptomyces lydicus]